MLGMLGHWRANNFLSVPKRKRFSYLRPQFYASFCRYSLRWYGKCANTLTATVSKWIIQPANYLGEPGIRQRAICLPVNSSGNQNHSSLRILLHLYKAIIQPRSSSSDFAVQLFRPKPEALRTAKSEEKVSNWRNAKASETAAEIKKRSAFQSFWRQPQLIPFCLNMPRSLGSRLFFMSMWIFSATSGTFSVSKSYAN